MEPRRNDQKRKHSPSENPWLPDQERETRWQKEKSECYQRWRSDKFRRGIKFLDAAKGAHDRQQRWTAIERKYGKRFRHDLEQEWSKHLRDKNLGRGQTPSVAAG